MEERPELGEAVRAILEELEVNGDAMGHRVAERKIGISHPMISELSRGLARTGRMVRRFADGFKRPRVPLLLAGGFPPLATDYEWDREHYGVLYASRINVTDDFTGDLRERGDVVRARIPTEGSKHMECSPPEYNPDDPDIIDVSDKVSALLVRGESMLPHYRQGDLVFVRPAEGQIKVGETYIVRIDGDRVCKTLESIEEEDGEEMLTFAPANSVYPRIRIASRRVVFQGIPITKIPRELL